MRERAIPLELPVGRMAAATSRWKELGYTLEAIQSRIGIADHRQNQTPRLADRLGAIAREWRSVPPSDAVGLMIQLLFLNNPVDRSGFQSAVGEEVIADLIDVGVARVDGEALKSHLTLSEWDGLYFASDTMWRRTDGDSFGSGPMPDDEVLNPVFDSFEFANSMIARPADRALDLCTGCGVVAIHASRSHREVVAVDNQERSVAFLRFNAALNQRTNIRAILGDMYSGVDGKFDTITANPPYMPCEDSTPGDNFYCGGPQGDVLTNAVLEGLDRYLLVGGSAHLVGFLICHADELAVGTTAPDLLAWIARGYDVELQTYDVPIGDPSVISAIASFGNARRLEYGPYSLIRRELSSGAGRLSRSRS